MNLSSLTGQPVPLSVAGRVYQLHPLTIEDLGKLQGWIDQQFPDPFTVVQEAISKGNYTVPQQQYLFSQAMERATRPRNLIGTPAADQLLQTLEGVKQTLLLSIRKGEPGFTDDEARNLYLHMGLGDVEKAFTATGVAIVMGDPKEQPRKSSQTGSSTSRPRRAGKR